MTGKGADPEGLAEVLPFQPRPKWLSDHPAYKLKVTIDGDRGTLHFECHFVDVKTGKVAAVTAANADLARIDNRWLITNFVGSTSELKIWSGVGEGTCGTRTQQPVVRNAGC